DKRAHDRSLELVFEIQNIKRDSEILSHAPRVIDVIERTASRRLRLLIGRKPSPLVPQLHCEADDLVSFLMSRALQHCGRDRTVHAAAHCYCYCHCLADLCPLAFALL